MGGLDLKEQREQCGSAVSLSVALAGVALGGKKCLLGLDEQVHLSSVSFSF